MSKPRFQLRSSIGKKLLNGLTGVLLLLFIVAHLAGNLTIFVGKDDMYFGNDRLPLIAAAVLARKAETHDA